MFRMSNSTSPITGLRYIGLAVENFDATLDFYTRLWGLAIVAQEDGLAYLGSPIGSEQFSLRLRKSAQKRIDLLSLNARSREEVDALAARLTKASIRKLAQAPQALSTPGGGYGLRFFDCDGRVIEVCADVARRTPRAATPREAIPRALSHVVLNTIDINKTTSFYEEQLGFRVSDWLEEFMCFLRCGPQHHILAIARGPHASLNHIAWEMDDIDSYMRATGRLSRGGHKTIWGPGRHGAGDNTFSYILDPAGNIAEFTTEMETVNEANWAVRRFVTTTEAQDQWGTGGLVTDGMIPTMFNAVDTGLWTAPPV
jgi:catechol 2,3-dioxygenase-like lactoylglutathione lyase family enzyme